MSRSFSRRSSSSEKRRIRFLLFLLAALLLAVVALIPLMSRLPARPNPEKRTVPLYTDSRLGEISGPYFEGVEQNTYDVAAFGQDQGFITYETEALTAKIGVDVSVHQGEIDWTQVADSGVEYAMIRVGRRGYTEGSVVKDAAFDANIQGALEAGLRVGVYFFSQAVTVEEAREEARQVLEWIHGYEITYPVVFDWEVIQESTARTGEVSGEELSALTAAFCQVIAQGGYTPAVYAGSQLVLRGLDLSVIRDYDLWLVEYKAAPTFYYDFTMWQYTASGQVPGIQGNVDLNLCFKEY